MPGASDGPQMPGLAQAHTPGTQFAVAGEGERGWRDSLHGCGSQREEGNRVEWDYCLSLSLSPLLLWVWALPLLQYATHTTPRHLAAGLGSRVMFCWGTMLK